jgi:hypothetical protein
VTSDPSTGGPVRATRAARHARHRRTRLSEIAAGLLVVVLVGWFLFGRGGDGSEPVVDGSPSPAGPTGPSRLLSLSVAGLALPHRAVIGAASDDRPASVLPIPMDMTVVVPGQGESEAIQVARLPGAAIQVALSNTVGTWTEAYAVITVRQLAEIVDREGGLTVDLPLPVTTAAGLVGPGETTLTGAQVRALLALKDDQAPVYWEHVLDGLLAAPPTLQSGDLAASNGVQLVQQILDGAEGAGILGFPTKVVVGTVTVAAQPALDDAVTEAFGTEAPIPAIVQNGNGAPGVGEEVGRRIIPAGFRIVISQNAATFGLPATDVIANGDENLLDARAARKALGVGRVGVSQVPSGIGDITIVVGKDFTA